MKYCMQKKDNLVIMGNMFYWNIIHASDSGRTIYALNANSRELVNKHFTPAPKKSKIAGWIFPFSLSFTNHKSEYVKPKIENISILAYPLSLLTPIAYLVFIPKRRQTVGVFDIIMIFLGGIFGFIATLVFRKDK